jgi:hypothetical protein
MNRSKLSGRMGLLLSTALLALAASVGYAQVGGGFDLSWNAIVGGGGTFSTAGSYSLGAEVGQPGAGSLAGTGPGGQYTLDGGFWGGVVSTPTPTNTPTRTPTPLPTQTPGGPSATPIPSNTPIYTPTDTPVPVVVTDTPTPTVTSTACPIQFSDVPNGSTFYVWIRCLACRGIVNGYSDGTFRPNNNVTRGQLSKIVSNSAGFNDPQTVQMFQDVPPTGPQSTFFVYIGRLASRGYISGYPCGGPGEPCIPPASLPYFRTNNNATRGQIAKIDSNAAGFNDPPTGQSFEDMPPGSTFYTYTERLVSRLVMAGYPCGSPAEPCIPPGNLPYFRPFNNATRGQTSKIVANTFFPNCQTPSRR